MILRTFERSARLSTAALLLAASFVLPSCGLGPDLRKRLDRANEDLSVGNYEAARDGS